MNHLRNKLNTCITIGLFGFTSTYAADGTRALRDATFNTADPLLTHLQEKLADGAAAKEALTHLKEQYSDLAAKNAALKWHQLVLKKKSADQPVVQTQTNWQRFTHWLGSLDYNRLIPIIILGIAEVIGLILTLI